MWNNAEEDHNALDKDINPTSNPTKGGKRKFYIYCSMTEYEIEVHRLERMLLFFVLVFVYELKFAKNSIFW